MVLQVEAIGLALLAIALAGPISAALAKARWPARNPRAALVLWQAVGLGGGLGLVGAGLTLAAASVDARWLPGIAAVPGDWSGLGVTGWIGVSLALSVGAWLVVVATLSTTRVVLARRSHRRRLDAVAEPLDAPVLARHGRTPVDARLAVRPDRDGGGRRSAVSGRTGVRLVDHPHAVAYCLPGLRPQVVVSRGTLQALDDAELAAVLAHERAHARGRHDLVIQPFVAWRETFPFLPTAARALAAVELLVEMLADDAARRGCHPGKLGGALERLSLEQVALSGRADVRLEAQVAARTARLADPPRPISATRRALVYVAALALVLAPPVILVVS